MGNFGNLNMMSRDAMTKVEDFMNGLNSQVANSKLNELIHKKEEEDSKKNTLLWILAIIGIVAAVAGIAYAVYRFFTPDYLDDFEDDFDDDFEDDSFDDEKKTGTKAKTE
jgi:flagellar basal body-associated protein FliL